MSTVSRHVRSTQKEHIHIHMVNPSVEGGPTVTKTRNEENGRRIYVTKKLVCEFGATLGCKGCLVIGQLHTEECWARITTRMENDPVHVKRLEDNLTRQSEFATPEPEVAAPSEGRTDATKRARQDEVGLPQESGNTKGASSSASGWRCDRQAAANDRWNQAATTTWCADWTCLTSSNEYSSDVFVNDCEGDCTEQVTGVTLQRRRGRSTCGRDGTVRQVQSLRRSDGRNVCVKNGTQTHLLSMERHQHRRQRTCGRAKSIGRA